MVFKMSLNKKKGFPWQVAYNNEWPDSCGSVRQDVNTYQIT